ncbi:hypothetical protein HMPREF0262_01081 [Clostridium sp. ATCC 29733]|nr:hypothetical protein HMPREF0262_01081 [Clostridium sp. ATCC 29733]
MLHECHRPPRILRRAAQAGFDDCATGRRFAQGLQRNTRFQKGRSSK